MKEVDPSTLHETRRGGPTKGRPAIVRCLVVMFAVGAVALTATASGAAQLVQPSSSSPYRVTLDSGSHPQPFTIAVSGFAPGQQVFVEQCDGMSPATANWDPTIDCDSGSSPAPVVVGSDGRATFPAADLNHRFTPFVGPSPQNQFVCLAAGGASPGTSGGVPSYSTCQVRVSSNNASITTDQLLFSIALPAGATPPPVTTPGVTTTTTGGAQASTSTRPGAGAAATTTTRPAHKTTTTVASTLAGTGAGAAGPHSGGGSSARSVGWLIAGVVLAAGVAGYLWAWRRRRSLPAT